MAGQTRQKLNQIAHLLPENLLADSAWMNRHGYSTSLRSQYVAAGWLQHPLRHVYRRSRKPMTWQQVVVSLQTLLGNDLIVGGSSALELQGFAHFLSSHGMPRVYLYGRQAPPTWLSHVPLQTEFEYRNSLRLFRKPAGIVNRDPAELSLQQSEGLPLIVSNPERALLELLDELPGRESFHNADLMMEGMTTLSPGRLQFLLQDCRSIKVKRLFFFFADRRQHSWLKHIDKSAIDLGKGKRMLERGGRLDPTYQITVPDDL